MLRELILTVEIRGRGRTGSPRLRDRLQHLVEDEVPRPLRLLEHVAHDLLRDAGDLDVHLQRGDAVAEDPDHLEVHVAQVVARTLDVRQDHVVVALLDEAHRDPRDRRLDRRAGVVERERVEPRTEPIDDEPFDSSVSETTRIVYGNSSVPGNRLQRPLHRAPWPMSRRLGPRMKPVSPTE